MKKKRAMRPRSERRGEERGKQKLFEARTKLAALTAGGSAERPIEVTSASLVEVRAEGECCLRCGLSVRCLEHTVAPTDAGLLRVARLQCKQCGTERALYFRVVERTLN